MQYPDNAMKREINVHRHEIAGEWNEVPFDLALNDKLSYGARGLLMELLSYPPDHQFHMTSIEKNATKDGVQRVRGLKQELIDSGYLRRTLVKDQKGKVAKHRWEVTDTPWVFSSDLDTDHWTE